MWATKQRVVACAETMQATKQRAKVDPLMQEVHMQATKQLADPGTPPRHSYRVIFCSKYRVVILEL